MNPVHFAGVRHPVEGEVQGAAPDVLNLYILELWIDLNHLAPENLGAALHCAGCLREEGGAPTEDHSLIPETEVIQVMFVVEDHTPVGDQLSDEFIWQGLGCDDERANGDDLLLQLLRDTPRVARCPDQDFLCAKPASFRLDEKALSRPLQTGDACPDVERCPSLFCSSRKPRDILRGVQP